MKISFSNKNIFRIIYAFFIIANLVSIFYLANFFKKYIYYTYFPEKDQYTALLNKQTSDVNMAKFEAIIANSQKKSIPIDIDNTEDIFD